MTKVVSGKDAYVNNVPCTTSWQVTENVNLNEYAASCTGDGTGVAEGNIDWSGSMSGIGGNPPVFPDGNDFTFKGVADNESGDVMAYDGTILINSLQISIPVQQGGPITWNANFGVQGVLSENASVSATDSTFVDTESAKNGGVRLGPSGSSVIDDVQSITLNFNRPEATYVDAGVTRRKTGNLRAGVSFDIFARELNVAAYSANTVNHCRVYVSAATYWDLSIRFGSKTNFVVNRDDNSLVGYTVNGMWTAVVPSIFDQDNEGWIKDPADVYKWGAAPVTS